MDKIQFDMEMSRDEVTLDESDPVRTLPSRQTFSCAGKQ